MFTRIRKFPSHLILLFPLSFAPMSPPSLQSPVFQTIDEYPPPVEPVRIFAGVTVTLTASFFDCPLPITKMPCTNAKLGNSPMECTWIKQIGGGEVRLIGTPLEPTLADPRTNVAYNFPVTFRRTAHLPQCFCVTVQPQVSFTIDGLQYSYGIAGGFGSVRNAQARMIDNLFHA